jgi:DNA-3-methyladenine glycosylase II
VAYGLPDLPNAAELAKLGQRWRPYCSVATWYLWRSLDSIAAI